MGLFAELKRRNVIRVAGVYIVVGWILVQVATALEESIGLPEWFDGLIVALLLIGLPVAVIFAWAFELTPEGVVKTEAVPEGQSITSETGRKLDFALAIAIVALVIVIIWQSTTSPEPVAVEQVAVEAVESDAPSDASVAVLPFQDMSAAGDQEYFTDGLSEEILNLLVRADVIEVVSRTSSFQFKNTTLGIPQIAAELNVRHIVEGSVRKAGDTVRVTAQLIDTLTDRHLWSNTYDRSLTTENLFEIQDDVANSIVNALSQELGFLDEIKLRAKRTTDNVDAYTLFLRARTLYDARRDLDIVEDLLRQAVEMDPTFAQAWEYRAGNQTIIGEYGYTDLSRDELNQLGLEYAHRALELDAESSTALAAIGSVNRDLAISGKHELSWVEAVQYFDRALEINPRDPSALNWRGLERVYSGDLEAALEDFTRCIEYEPYYVPCIENKHWYLAELGRDEEALAAAHYALSVGISKNLYFNLGLFARIENEFAFKAVTNNIAALRDWRRHDELYLAFQDLDADHSELAASIAAFYAANPDRNADFMVPVLVALGNFDSLADETAYRTPLYIWGNTFRKYRKSDDFKRLMTTSGIHEYWVETGFPAGCRPLGDDDFECD